MGDPKDHVQSVRDRGHHGRHGGDSTLVPFARPDQPETQDDRSPGEVESRLHQVWVHARKVRHAVGDHADPHGTDAVHPREERGGSVRHHHHAIHRGTQSSQDAVLRGSGRPSDGVQRGHGRHRQGAHEVEHVLAVAAAPDPVFVLNGDELDPVSREAGGSPTVVQRDVTADAVTDLGRVARGRADGVQRHHTRGAGRPHEVLGEGGDAALARWIGGHDGRIERHRSLLSRALVEARPWVTEPREDGNRRRLGTRLPAVRDCALQQDPSLTEPHARDAAGSSRALPDAGSAIHVATFKPTQYTKLPSNNRPFGRVCGSQYERGSLRGTGASRRAPAHRRKAESSPTASCEHCGRLLARMRALDLTHSWVGSPRAVSATRATW